MQNKAVVALPALTQLLLVEMETFDTQRVKTVIEKAQEIASLQTAALSENHVIVACILAADTETSLTSQKRKLFIKYLLQEYHLEILEQELGLFTDATESCTAKDLPRVVDKAADLIKTAANADQARTMLNLNIALALIKSDQCIKDRTARREFFIFCMRRLRVLWGKLSGDIMGIYLDASSGIKAKEIEDLAKKGSRFFSQT